MKPNICHGLCRQRHSDGVLLSYDLATALLARILKQHTALFARILVKFLRATVTRHTDTLCIAVLLLRILVKFIRPSRATNTLWHSKGTLADDSLIPIRACLFAFVCLLVAFPVDVPRCLDGNVRRDQGEWERGHLL